MNSQATTFPCWSTATFDQTAPAALTESTGLGAHLSLCQVTGGHLFALRCVAETMGGFVAARFVTTLVVIALLIGVTSLVL